LLSEDDSPAEELAKIKQATKTINKYMRRIGEKLEIDMKLTTYTARHSFATILKRSGAPIEFISESLGHKDLKTTENYLDSFEDDAKESYQKQLLNFSKEKTEAKGS
jgi:site-specific recombinase XerD